MDKLKKIYKDNHFDFKYLFILYAVFILYSIIYWGSWGSLFIDNGREAYLPQVMLQGEILYKDIFAMYTPLGYQINAIVYALFGANLNVLQMCGTVATFFILTALYLTSRQFIKPFYTFIFCFFVLAQFLFFSLSCVNYIFPYSYGMLYSLMFFIWYVFLTFKYLKTDDKHYLCLSSLFIGLSIACRFEFLLCIIPFLVIMIKKENFKTILLNVIIILLPLILSWGVLFLQGFTIDDFVNYIQFLYRFFNTQEQKIFSSAVAPGISFQLIYYLTSNFCMLAVFLIVNIFAVKFITYKKNVFFRIFIVAVIFILNLILTKPMILHNIVFFCWCAISSVIICILSFKNNQKYLALLALYAVLSCCRVNFILSNAFSYSIYYILLPLLVNWIYFLNIENAFIKKHDIKKLLAIFLIIYSVVLAAFHAFTIKTTFHELNTPKGKISNPGIYAMVFEKTMNWVNQNTNKDDVILMLPEGPLINFITERKTNSKYYHLIPNHITALDENSIITGLSTNPPDFILINNYNYKLYGNDNMCNSFAPLICIFVDTNYDHITRYYSGSSNENFSIDIYKLRKTGK